MAYIRKSVSTTSLHIFWRAVMITACFLMLASSSLLAQNLGAEKMIQTADFGLKSGVNFAELWGEDAIPESDRKVGYSFGMFATFKIKPDLKLQPEAIWSLQGEKSQSNGRYKITYLHMPVMFKWTAGKWYTEFGPQLGLLTISTSQSVPEAIRLDNFETIDWAMNVGMGYQMDDVWAFGMRYSQGLMNLVDNKDLKNSVMYLGISYRLF